MYPVARLNKNSLYKCYIICKNIFNKNIYGLVAKVLVCDTRWARFESQCGWKIIIF